MEDQVKCPKCESTQISATKKGLSGVKAVTGTVIAGPLGIAAGTIGSNKIILTCLKCGHQFRPGEQLKEVKEAVIEKESRAGYVRLIPKEDLEPVDSYKCHYCGWIANAYRRCPHCGTPYNKEDLYQGEPMKLKRGCFGLAVVSLIVIVFLWMMNI